MTRQPALVPGSGGGRPPVPIIATGCPDDARHLPPGRRGAGTRLRHGLDLRRFRPRPGGAAKPPPPAPAPVRVFVDCQSASCDYDYFRTEIAFVDHVRDRKDADVHVLITGQTTGSGGHEYSLKFIGLGRFQGVDAAMVYAASVDATSDQIRKALVQHLTLGLVRYAAESPAGPRLTVKYTPETAKAGGQSRQEGRDPWDYWVFRLSGSGYFNGEESTSSTSFYGSASANRTTEAWKINLSFSGDYNSSAYDLGEGETFTSITKSYYGSGRVVKSLGAALGRGRERTGVAVDLLESGPRRSAAVGSRVRPVSLRRIDAPATALPVDGRRHRVRLRRGDRLREDERDRSHPLCRRLARPQAAMGSGEHQVRLHAGAQRPRPVPAGRLRPGSTCGCSKGSR